MKIFTQGIGFWVEKGLNNNLKRLKRNRFSGKKSVPSSLKTYAEITSNPKPKSKRVPKLIIKKTEKEDSTDVEKTVLQHLTQDKTIPTKSVAEKNNDT